MNKENYNLIRGCNQLLMLTKYTATMLTLLLIIVMATKCIFLGDTYGTEIPIAIGALAIIGVNGKVENYKSELHKED